MIQIGIDTRMIRHTGIGTYLKGLLGKLFESPKSRKFSFGLFGATPLNGALSQVPQFSFESKIYSLSEQWTYPSKLKQCQLWHAPHYNVPLWKGKTPFVVTIHDVIHWIFRKDFLSPIQAFYAERMLKEATQKSKHILTVSQNTKEDLVKYFRADPEKISVIYEGISERFHAQKDQGVIESVLSKYKIPKNYFLYVGMLKPHKNVLWLAECFKKLWKNQAGEARLVLVGPKDQSYPQGYEAIQALGSEEPIIHIPYVESEELLVLYQGAKALVHASLYEGFGLTLLEAMACGTPVIASRAGSIPEVTGDAALLFDPESEQEFKNNMLKVLESDSYSDEYRQRGLEHIKQFSWQLTADKTLEVYEKNL